MTDETITSDLNTTRKDAENLAKKHINTIWQSIEDVVLWPIEKIEALIEDLKKHV